MATGSDDFLLFSVVEVNFGFAFLSRATAKTSSICLTGIKVIFLP